MRKKLRAPALAKLEKQKEKKGKREALTKRMEEYRPKKKVKRNAVGTSRVIQGAKKRVFSA